MSEKPVLPVTRENLSSGKLAALVAERNDAETQLATDEQLLASRRAVVPDDADTSDIWVFGYGSLIFNPVMDFVDRASGRIQHYLVARSDPRLPGSSRWRLEPDRLIDQQPGQVHASLDQLDDLPLDRASIRQQVLRRSRQIREQVPDSMDGFEDRLRSWGQRLWDGGEDLIERWREDDEPPEPERRQSRMRDRSREWDDESDGDPWI